MRVAYTLEQCWHRVPGGTGVAAMRVAAAMAEHVDDVTLIGVAGRHRHQPPPPWAPTMPVAHLSIGGPLLYDAWLWTQWPKVEQATGPIDVAHATTIIPCATKAPLVVTVHDVAFLHDPAHFSRRGNLIFRRSLEQIRHRADLVLCSSQATMDDCASAGIDSDKLRLVPLGVDVGVLGDDEIARVRALYRLPQRYLLFVGTVEPRKNLSGLARALARLADPVPLVVAGADGWGDVEMPEKADVRFVGFVPDEDLGGLYSGAEVFCYPSEREGYGLPVLEAMAHGTPVVTSLGTATEEAAGGAAVLVDPLDVDDIARGIETARRDRDTLVQRGLTRAAAASWSVTAELTASAYRELAG